MNHFLKSIKFPNGYTLNPLGVSTNPKFKIIKTIEEAEGRDLTILENKKRKELEKKGVKIEFFQTPKLTKKERMISVETYIIDLYDVNFEVKFNAGLNIIVGENGCGKSTLLHNIHKSFIKNNEDCIIESENLSQSNLTGFDFEKDNPRFNNRISPDDPHCVNKAISLFMVNEESHGETNIACIQQFKNAKGYLILFDEPETALSIKNQYKFYSFIKELSEHNQIIMITHNKIFIEETESVYDMESNKWLNGTEYIKNCKQK